MILSVNKKNKESFDVARKKVEEKYLEIRNDVSLKIRDLLEKTYKQFD